MFVPNTFKALWFSEISFFKSVSTEKANAEAAVSGAGKATEDLCWHIYAVPMAELIVPPKHLYFLGFFPLTLEMEAQPHLHTGSVDGMYMEFICNFSLFSKLDHCWCCRSRNIIQLPFSPTERKRESYRWGFVFLWTWSSDQFYTQIFSLSPVNFIFTHLNISDSRI